jgi:hypothetical protein
MYVNIGGLPLGWLVLCRTSRKLKFNMRIKEVAKKYRGPLLIFLVVLFANSLFVTGQFKSNPIDQFSGAVTFTHVGLYGVYSVIDPNNAYTTQALGHAAARDLLRGHLPWWNYNEQVGAPLAGEMQSAALFLPFNLLFAFSTGVLYFHIALELVAGIATYYLLKRLSCSEFASVVGGSLFALNGSFAWFGSANINPIAFLPLLILGIEIALDKSKKSRKGGWEVIAVALALSLYAGFPEAAFLDGILAGVWFMARAIQHKDAEWLPFTKKVLTGLAAGLLLAAPILLAFADYLPFANVGAHVGLFSQFALPGSTLPALVMPYIYGPIFQFASYDHSGTLLNFWDNIGGYISAVVVFLALVGVLLHQRKNRAIVYALGIFSIVVTARIYGLPGVAQIINIIPGMHRVAVYRYVNPTLELAVIVLAMFGFDALMKARKLDHNKIIMAGAAMLLLVACLIPVAVSIDHRLYLASHHRLYLTASIAWALGSVASIVLSTLYFKKYLRILLPLVVLVDALVMFIAPQFSAPRATTVDLKPVHYLQKNLGNARFYSLGYIMPNYGSYYGIAAINTNNVPAAQDWSVYINKHLNPNVDPLQEFTGVDRRDPNGITPVQAFFTNLRNYEQVGVKYVVIRDGLLGSFKPQDYSLRLVFTDQDFQVYELPHPQPYFQVVRGACRLSDSTRTSLSARCTQPSTIVRRELYAKGWTARTSGRSIAIKKSGDLFQAVDLPAGITKVTFNYTPPHMVLAYVAFAGGLCLLVYPTIQEISSKRAYRQPTTNRR